ncbi:MAG: hypothetical protein QOJ42_2097, partial [Acidobacteriaceae bacterium]|nr:hypothetical protein [Acidobacteriaceae bacterium]
KACHRRWAACGKPQRYAACRQILPVGAGCLNWARPDLRGGRPEMVVPTAFLPVPALRSTNSATGCPALFAGFVATMAESDFSGPCIIGFDSSSSRCGPTVFLRWPNPRSPDSRTKSVHTCQGLRPRRVGRALALTHPSISPSVIMTTSASGTFKLSRLNGWPMRSPTDASPIPSRVPTHGSGPMRIATPSTWGTFTSYSLPVLIGAP